MLKPPDNYVAAGPAVNHPERLTPVSSIPAGLALKKECVMDKAAFELLEQLTAAALRRFRLLRRAETDLEAERELTEEINELDRLWDKARHEQKGGTQ